MYRCLPLLLFFVLAQKSNSFAQQQYTDISKIPGTEYYLYISGIKTHAAYEKLFDEISKKPGVTIFWAKGIPAKYFLLKSTTPVTKELFTSWIDQGLYKVEYFGVGPESKEFAMGVGTKFNKPR